MAEPTEPDVIQAAIDDWVVDQAIDVRGSDVLADRIAAALAEGRDARRGGAMLTADELNLCRRWAAVGDEGSPLARLLAHVDAQAAEIERLREERDA